MTADFSGHTDADRERLVRVAWYYYRDSLTQAQIADRMHISRPTVARLLERARQSGVVAIDIDTSHVGGLELSLHLQEKYNLEGVVVVPQLGAAPSGEATNSRVAQQAAQYVGRFLRPGVTVGVGWGDTVRRTLLALRRSSLPGVTFAALTGGVEVYMGNVGAAAGDNLAVNMRFVPSPLLASSPAMADALRQEKEVTSVLELAQSADITLIGVGGAIPNATILERGMVSQEQLLDYQKRGAVGDIIGEWYDEHGSPVPIDMQRVRIGLEISELRSMKKVVAAAGGIDKVAAISGALAGGYLDVLITTEDVAVALAGRT